jgi:integrase
MPSESFPLERRRLKPSQWPEADRGAWERATAAAPTPLDRPGPAQRLAASTHRGRTGAWGSFLAFLVARGLLDPREGPGERLTYARLTGFIAAARTHMSAATLRHLVLDLTLVMEDMVPERDWRWVLRHPDRPTEAEAQAARKPVEPFDPVQLLIQADEMSRKAQGAALSFLNARRFRDGLILGLATHTALRVSNLASIRIGQHLRQGGDMHVLCFDVSETKNRMPMQIAWPPRLEPALVCYLEHFRPILLGGREDHGMLWVGTGGRPLAKTAFYGLFRRRGEELCERRINPHLVRHTLATGILKADPRQVETAGAALHHRNTKTITEVHDRAGRDGAQREWRKALAAAVRRTKT